MYWPESKMIIINCFENKKKLDGDGEILHNSSIPEYTFNNDINIVFSMVLLIVK